MSTKLESPDYQTLRALLKVAGEDLDMPRALTSAVIYRGPSMLDGAPIVVVAIVDSDNRKTDSDSASMVQTYILRADMDPQSAVKVGADASICGACIQRGQYDENGALIPGSRTCYVTLWQGPRMVFTTYRAGRYRDVCGRPDDIAALGFGRMVRLGTYGDPAAVPVDVWHALLSQSLGHTGYTHQWRSARLAGQLRGLLMASCDNAQDRAKAQAKGWDTFTVVPHGATLEGLQCPASVNESVSCADCRKCTGAQSADVWIEAHGATSAKYTGQRVARRFLPTL